MIFPAFLRPGDTVGITAPSAGVDPADTEFDFSLSVLRAAGYRIRESADVRTGLPAGAPRQTRGRELNGLLRDDAVSALCANLLPMAEVLTPNIPEAEILADMPIKNAADMEKAAQTISEKYGCAVLCKGGHQINDADDLLWRGGAGKWFRGKRIDNPNTHGTGCTLSSAIASNLAKGYDLDASVERAKAYISGALAAMLDLGRGSGPMDHMFALKGEFTE